jgi:NosR/NirI family transcriptional regulator, nitrous oxide reductase regulator
MAFNIPPIEFSPLFGMRGQPVVDGDHESSVAGLYVVGDLSNAPLIKVALHQGYTVAKQVASSLDRGLESDVAVLVVGAGPAGLGASLALHELGIPHIVVEKDKPLQTIENFPEGKLLYSEPASIDPPAGLWFEDAPKEVLVERWRKAIEERELPIKCSEVLVGLERTNGIFRADIGSVSTKPLPSDSSPQLKQYTAQRVILAVGKRSAPRRLGLQGEDLPQVHYRLQDPNAFHGARTLVVGGGDSAVETACALAESGALVSLSYRRREFHRIRPRNEERLRDCREKRGVQIHMESQPTEIGPKSVRLSTGEKLDAEAVFICIGNESPRMFLRSLGLRLIGDKTFLGASWLLFFGFVTYLFYILKSGLKCAGAGAEIIGRQCVGGEWVAKRGLFPFGEGDSISFLPGMLHGDIGFRMVDGAFWGTVLYSLLILGFGLRALYKYRSKEQQRRYRSLILFQLLFLFGLPEVVAPALLHIGGEDGLIWTLLGGDRGWKLYALFVPWPLSLWSLIDAPNWTAGGSVGTALLWIMLGAMVSFIAIPLYVRKHGQRFCSYLCGCGGLAETLGDIWRELAPRGSSAKRLEISGRWIFLSAMPVTLLILNDAWGFLDSNALQNASVFAQHWYGLMVDFWLASILGVALYPYLGNRVWCRFFCPLRAYMEMLSSKFSRISIHSNDRCIGCGECTLYCQMGIDVQTFAQKRLELDNSNSACIQCGICIEVCPMNVLEIGEKGQAVTISHLLVAPPTAPWEGR